MRNKVIGSSFIILALIVILNELNVIHFNIGLNLIIGIFCGYWFIECLWKRRYTTMVIPATILVIILNNHFNWIISETAIVWCGIFAYIGLSFLLPKKNVRIYKKSLKSGKYGNYTTVFSQSSFYVDNKQTNKYEPVCVFGSSTMYFTEEDLLDDVIYIDAAVVFGSLTISLPKEWAIENRVFTLFGSCENRLLFADGNKKMIIDGAAIFGSIEFMYT